MKKSSLTSVESVIKVGEKYRKATQLHERNPFLSFKWTIKNSFDYFTNFHFKFHIN